LDRRVCDAAARSDDTLGFESWRSRLREAFRITIGAAGRRVHAELHGELVGDESTILQRLLDRRQRSFEHGPRLCVLDPDLEAHVAAIQHDVDAHGTELRWIETQRHRLAAFVTNGGDLPDDLLGHRSARYR